MLRYLEAYVLCRWPLFSSLRLPFGELGASILAPWETILAPREPLGGPWEQQDGLERVRHRSFIDLGMILRPYFESFLGTDA